VTAVYSMCPYGGRFMGGVDGLGKRLTVYLSDGLVPTAMALPRRELSDVTRRRQ
jgi:hypothetical protein